MNDITTLISSKLIEIFGAESTIYRENVKSGFEENSFFLPAINIKSKSQLGFIHDVTYNCQIVYFPRSYHENDDIQGIQDRLIIDFLDLSGNDVFNRNFTISDNSLVFTFDLIGYVAPKNEGNKFKSIEVERK